MAMGACRLFDRARQYTYSKEMGCLNKTRFKNFLEKEWSEVTLQAEKFTREQGSPFCFPILNTGNALLNFDGKNLEEHSRGNLIKEDHVSSNNDFLNGDGKKLEERLRECKDITLSTDFYSILQDKRLKEFQSSMTPKEIWHCVMRHLYSLTLQKVVPSEKLYMTYLIDRFHNLKVDLIQLTPPHEVVVFRPARKLRILRRWKQVFRPAMDVPLYCIGCILEASFPMVSYKKKVEHPLQVLQDELLGKLEKDYKLLTLKFHDLPMISEDRMSNEIISLVLKCGPYNPRCSYAKPYLGWVPKKTYF